MQETKKPLKSLTIFGGFLSLIPGIVEGLNEVATLPIVPGHISIILSSVGGLLSIIGRFRASKKVEF